MQFPVLPVLHGVLFTLYRFVLVGTQRFLIFFLWSPLFRSQLANHPKAMTLYGWGIPDLFGNKVDITMGEHCRISSKVAFTGRFNADGTVPTVTIGENVDLSVGVEINCATRVVIGNNVRFSGLTFLSGYPGHPIDAKDRAEGLPDTEDQVGDIIIEEDVWVGKRVYIGPNVTIGKGSIIATMSAVTKSIPPGVLAGGVPAKVIRKITPKDRKENP